MPTPKKGARLGGSPAHQRLILSNLATALFEHGRITKLGPRKGDNAPMAVIELVTEAFTPGAGSASSSRSTSTSAPAAVSQPAADAPAEVVATDETGTEQVVDTEPTDVNAAQVQAQTDGESAYPGSHAPLADPEEAPEGFPIKGNEDSKKFHEPDGRWFEQTVAEVWFDTAESAEAAGFTKAGA